MKPFHEYPEFVRSTVQTAVALVSALAGICVAGFYASGGVHLRSLFGNMKLADLEFAAIACETFVVGGVITTFSASLLYRRLGASQNVAVVLDGQREFSVIVRILAATIMMVLHSTQLDRPASVEVGQVTGAMLVVVILAPIFARRT